MEYKHSKLIIILSLAILLFIFFLFWFRDVGEKKLSQSFRLISGQLFKGQYKIKTAVFDSASVDLNGYWAVTIEDDLFMEQNFFKRFEKADNADFRFYSKVFTDKLSINKSFDGYELYRSEMVLGKGSICEKQPCNIDILTRKGVKEVYIGISNN